MGGLAHLIEYYKKKYILWYYAFMTIGISGNMLRSNYGYALKVNNKYIIINNTLSIILLFIIYISNIGIIYSYIYKIKNLYLLELIYFYCYKYFVIIEILGSLIWYSNIETKYKYWCLIATGFNISNWLLLRTFPIIMYMLDINVNSSVVFRLSHYKQFIIIWILHSINLLEYFY